MPPLIITIDVEDWQQSTWDRSLPVSRNAADNTLRLLDLLEELAVRTTMFIQGNFAAAFPDIVKKIHAAGHEIACHGYDHLEIFRQSRDDFRQDVLKAQRLLEDITAEKILGYRAPDFSIVVSTLWALDFLAELGFCYDASIFPIRGARYGIPEFPASPVELLLPSGNRIVEIPVGTWTLGNKNFPAGGGGYFRLLPGSVSRYLIGATLKNRPFVFYCHPYEFNPGEFSALQINIPFKTRLHQGLGRRFFKARFVSLVRRFGGCSIRDMLDSCEMQTMPLADIQCNLLGTE